MPSFRGRNRQTDPRERKKQISRNRRRAYLASYHHCVGIGQRSVDGERSVEESVGDVRMQRELLRFILKPHRLLIVRISKAAKCKGRKQGRRQAWANLKMAIDGPGQDNIIVASMVGIGISRRLKPEHRSVSGWGMRTLLHYNR